MFVQTKQKKSGSPNVFISVFEDVFQSKSIVQSVLTLAKTKRIARLDI